MIAVHSSRPMHSKDEKYIFGSTFFFLSFSQSCSDVSIRDFTVTMNHPKRIRYDDARRCILDSRNTRVTSYDLRTSLPIILTLTITWDCLISSHYPLEFDFQLSRVLIVTGIILLWKLCMKLIFIKLLKFIYRFFWYFLFWPLS